MSMGSF
ncbi:unnamed protein product [Acanthoscelides obtectus]|nr:unnamed protein product [Acanthoscelides obtectus]CAK1633525.1 hypothetical protein AOBTE_LOCUS8195 [Acanthoscelides obtectus]